MKEIDEKEFYEMIDNGQEEFDGIRIIGVCIKDISVDRLMLINCNFENVTFTNFIVHDLSITNCSFNHCNYLNSQIEDDGETSICMDHSNFNHCFFDNISIEAINLQSDMVDTKFYKSKFQNIYFYVYASIGGCVFEKCILEQIDVRVIEIYSSILEKATIENAKIQASFVNNSIKDVRIQNCSLEAERLSRWDPEIMNNEI